MPGPIRIAIVANGSQARREIQQTASSATRSLSAVKGIAAGLAAGVGLTGVAQGLKDVIAEGRESQVVGQQTNAVLKSTGQVANVTAKHVGDLATAISKKAAVDDETIQSGENLLLTFKGVRNEVGAGNKIFDRAARVSVDLAAGLAAANGSSLNLRSSTTLVGKALNDPIKGLSALARVGVTFTEGQKDQIKGLVATGHTLEAQKIILRELTSEFGGSAAAQATAGKRLGVVWKNLEEELGLKLIPVLDKVETYVADHLPEWFDKAGSAITQARDEAAPFVPMLENLASAAAGLARFLVGLPDPVKKFGLEGALAAVAISKLSTSVGGMRLTGFVRDLSNSETRLSAVSRASYALGAGIRNLAGAGGLLLLANSVRQSNKDIGLLEKTAGGAAVGFAMGGPWGAAIGTVGGLTLGLVDLTKSINAEKRAQEAANQATRDHIAALTGVKPSLADYKNTLDQTTGAITKNTRASILQKLQQDQIISQGAALGLSARTLVNATLGQKGALDKVNASWADFIAQNPNAIGGLSAVGQWVQTQNGYLRDNQGQIRANTAAITDYSKTLLNKLPKQVRTEVTTNGIEPSTQAIAALATKYKLTPKEIRTLITLSGADTSVAAVRKVQTNVQSSTGKIKGDLKGAGRVTTDMSPFLRSLSGGLSQARGTASRGARGVGEAMKAGLLAGMAGMAQSAASQAAAAVAAAIAAAKTHGKISSPSKETIYIGEMLGEGLAVGLERKKARTSEATKALVASLIKAAGDGTDELRSKLQDALDDATKKRLEALRKYLDQHTKLTDSAISKKVDQAQKQLDKQTAALLAATKKQRDALVRQEAALAAVNDRLDDAKQKLADVVQQQKDYAASIKASVLAAADITQVLGSGDDALAATAGNIVAGLQARADAVQAYVATLLQLKNLGLNQTTLQQLLDAGVDGGLATAQGLAQGGKSAVDQVNAIESNLTSAADQLGVSMSHTMYDAGVAAAQGMVKGLQSQQAQLTKVAQQMAAALVAEVKKGLKIHSPSRVFEDIGGQTVKGLTIGLDQTYVKRSGAQLAASLVKGFAEPQLTARAALADRSSMSAAGDDLAERLAILLAERFDAQEGELRAGVRDAVAEALGNGVASRLERAARKARTMERSGARS